MLTFNNATNMLPRNNAKVETHNLWESIENVTEVAKVQTLFSLVKVQIPTSTE